MRLFWSVVAISWAVVGCDHSGLPVPTGADASVSDAGSDAGCRPQKVSTPTTHRPTPPAACVAQSPPTCTAPGAQGCSTDGQCTSGLDGRCVQAGTECQCIYDACLTDADCGTGRDCQCNGSRLGPAAGNDSICLPSNCRLDADCGAGAFCSPSTSPGGCGTLSGWFCHTSSDECGTDSDCASSSCGANFPICVYAPELGHWACAASHACAG